MIYQEGEILIRDMNESDPAYFTAEEIKQGWSADEGKLKGRLADAQDGLATVITAEYCGVPAGYLAVYRDGKDGPANRYAEIVDLNVLEKFRRKGIGSALMNIAEKIASSYSDFVYLGVGLHSGYGSAQRMYIKRGYVPDGSGVWYKNEVLTPYSECVNDDDLVLYLFKNLTVRN